MHNEEPIFRISYGLLRKGFADEDKLQSYVPKYISAEECQEIIETKGENLTSNGAILPNILINIAKKNAPLHQRKLRLPLCVPKKRMKNGVLHRNRLQPQAIGLGKHLTASRRR
ncbi:hypothetical protein [Paenibacillus melissococcoides]|uniref:hypothetical protein n=1 Tax=Paenibacillus melissococcoides TaxID=2912268 RepID=UPI0021C402EC|nr:hypothetical protein [Paenibacillus melissococcoides]CAH8712563.1 hypothetical protein HTL2_003323 [Paenibacillus melissococcoides]